MRLASYNCRSTVGLVFAAVLATMAGCASQKPIVHIPQRPDIKPAATSAPRDALQLDASQIRPMYTQLLPVDLESVVRTAAADNLAIKQARLSVEASRGRYESTVGSAFPALVPTALFEHVEGTVRATEGNLVGVGFTTFEPSLAIQWVINPGRVIHDIVAAKKRLTASGQQEKAVVLETLRRSAVGFYDLVLAQARVSAAHQGVAEADELFRITRLRTQTGTGVPADELRAEARLAQRQQERISAVRDFYNASVALALTLHLDPSVTLIPSIKSLPPTPLVREDLSIDEMIGAAVTFRPDLAQVRTLVEAAVADKGSTWWGAFGPEFSVEYRYGGITGHANNVGSANGVPGNLIVNPLSSSGAFSSNPVGSGVIKEGILRGSRRLDHRGDRTFAFHDQQRIRASAGWRLSLSAFGALKTAAAVHKQMHIKALRRLDRVHAEVVAASQESRAGKELVGLARRQVTAAEEALRLSETNLEAGTMTTLDVLQGQDAVTQARLGYAKAVVQYNQSQIDLLSALGLLDEDSLIQSTAVN